ncbi:MAG: hypothetical protein L3J59_13480 [Methylococcaceae bacterium]|nr:hypothetical protein [Methylococcaceae bacterium]
MNNYLSLVERSMRVAIFFMLSITIVSCGGGSNLNQPQLEYGVTDLEGENDLVKYTNAEWLYQNYLGEYGLPDELKGMVMPQMMMLANGFALQHSQGKDVEAAISRFDSGMKAMYYSGQLGVMVNQTVEAYQTEVSDQEVASEDVVEESIAIERVLDAEALNNIIESDAVYKNFTEEQKQLVIDHDLPYSLPELDIKSIVISESMKGGDSKGFAKDGNNTGPKTHQGIDAWNNWWEADFLWVDGAGGIGHMGLVTNTSSSIKHIIDANLGPGVSRHRGIDAWANNGGYNVVEGWYYTPWTPTFWRRANVVQRANHLTTVPTTYNVNFFNKRAVNSSYCSQLIWQSFYEEGVGIDLDHNKGLIVYPNDIRNHVDTAKFNSSVL